MKRIEAGLIMLLAIWFVGCGGSNEGTSGGGEPTIAPPKPAAITLFDGKSLDGWTMTGDANWHIVDDYMEANSGKGGQLVSANQYGDFKLTAEFWVDDDANSGIFIRCQDNTKIGGDSCYEVNIFDKRPDQKYRTGAIVNVAEPAVQINAGGQWNTYEITAQGPHMVVVLNGQTTADAMDSKLSSGYFTLQYGNGIVRFRNIKITPL